MANAIGLIYVQYGVESAYGTEVASTAKWMGLDPTLCKFTPIYTKARRRYARGDNAPAHKIINTATGGVLELGGDFNFDDGLALLASGVKGAVTPTGAGTDKTWLYPAGASNTVDSRTIEGTDGNTVYTFAGCTCRSFTLSGSNAQDGLVQFKSTWDVKSWTTNAMTAALSDRAVYCLPGIKMDIYIDDEAGTIGSTAKTGSLLDWEVTWEYAMPKWRAAGTSTAYRIGYKIPVMSMKYTLEAAAIGKAELGKWQSTTGRLVRLVGAGPTIGAGPATYKLQLDAAGDYTGDPALFDAEENDTLIKFTLEPRTDSGAFANYFKATIVNELAAVVG